MESVGYLARDIGEHIVVQAGDVLLHVFNVLL
jgi:hypothetical protein